MTNQIEHLQALVTRPDAADPERLDVALRLWYSEKNGLPLLQHPLVYQVPFFSADLANETLEFKLQQIARLEAENNVTAIPTYYERPWRIPYIMDNARRWPRATLRDALVEWWTDSEMPSQYGYARIARLFRRAGFVSDLEAIDTGLPGVTGPDGGNPIAVPTRVWRGVPSMRHARGVSWTKSPAVAAWFAARFAPARGGVVLETVIEPSAALALFARRKESEVIVDPKLLGAITVVERGVQRGAAR